MVEIIVGKRCRASCRAAADQWPLISVSGQKTGDRGSDPEHIYASGRLSHRTFGKTSLAVSQTRGAGAQQKSGATPRRLSGQGQRSPAARRAGASESCRRKRELSNPLVISAAHKWFE